MAKSGMTLEASKGGNLAHNNREHKIDYLIEGNYFCDRTESQALDYLQELRAEAQKNYTERTGQKMQIDINDNKYIWSAVVNLNAEHTLQDVQELAKELEKKHGWQCIQVAVHHDEGKPDGTRKNLHAHIEFFMVSKEGKTVFKKKDFRQKQMSELQTFVAEQLHMERGEIYHETKNHKKHLKPDAYKAKVRELEAKEVETYDFREMQKTITALENASVEDKKELHKLNSAVKNHKAEVTDLKEQLARFKGLYETRDNTAIVRLQTIRQLSDELDTSKTLINDLESKNKHLNEELVQKAEKINSGANLDVLEHETKEYIEEQLEVKLKKEGFTIPKAIKWLVDKVKDFTTKITELTAENKGLKAQNELLKATVELHNERLENEQSNSSEVDDWWNKKMAESTEFGKPTENSNKIDEIVQQFKPRKDRR